MTLRSFSSLQMLLLLLTLLLSPPCLAFNNMMPKMPWDNNDAGSSSSGSNNQLSSKDTIAVVGASGNVGKLVSLRLADSFASVQGIVRDGSSVKAFFGGKPNIRLHEVDLLDTSTTTQPALREALEKANAIVICTGTTAFPTKAWSTSGKSDIASTVLTQFAKNSFKIDETLKALDEMSLNTPYNVDAKANEFLVETWKSVCKVPKKRIIMLSSIGVNRRDGMPFTILNTCGVLDAKAYGENCMKSIPGCSYTIIRPGQLFGGPYDNNYYLGTLFQLDKDEATRDIEFGLGDELLGDTLRSTLAEVTAQVLETNACLNTDFAVINVKGDAPSVETVQERLLAL